MSGKSSTEVHILAGSAILEGTLTVPEDSQGLVLFAHGRGSSRRSTRSRFVADRLNDRRMGTLLLDLFTAQEGELDARTAELRFDIELLASRLTSAVDWVSRRPPLTRARLGLFCASTGTASALITATERADVIHAVVSRGGRPDLAGSVRARVQAPTLLIVGAEDTRTVRLNQQAASRMARVELRVIPGATHLFAEPGALETVAELTTAWFLRHLGPAQPNEAAAHSAALSAACAASAMARREIP
jgi:dienelactone hydrolase